MVRLCGLPHAQTVHLGRDVGVLSPWHPHRPQQGAAEAIVKRKMQEDSILLTTLVNDLQENAVKDSYRASIADWLQQNGHKEDAAMWRASVKDQSVLDNK